MKRILFFAHYNKYNSFSDYIAYLLEHIKHIYDQIIFISNSPISDDNLYKIKDLCNEIIFRENKGFDFGAWKDAILKESCEKLLRFDNVTLMNDSCFGPIFDLQDIYTNMEQKNIDFWGLTLYKKTKNRMPDSNASIPEHIQSYFMCFNKSVISSKIFFKFWNDLEYLDDINKGISFYETKLTMLLSNNGFKYSVIYSINNKSDIKHNDVATWHPDIIIQNSIPFLRINSFIYFPYQKYIIDLIQKYSNYPVELIYNHVTEVFNPNLSLQICNKLVPAIPLNENISSTSVAIHLHTYYLDVFEIYLNYLNNIFIDFDLFITTDTVDKENKIRNLIKNTNTEKHLKNIIVTENKGRDILPWFNISDILNKYDVVGHFHTKKTIFEEEWIGKTWLNDILNLLLIPINKIINEFNKYSNLGIIIPEIPMCYQIHPSLIDKIEQKYLFSSLNKLWKKCNCIKEIDFFKLKTIIMPYGNMFWYRPASLQSLFQMHLSSDDFDSEPIKTNLTIAHFIERLPVYYAWNNGFDYRIMVFYPPQKSTFTDHIILSDTYNSINHSKSYRIGHFILFIPRMIMNIYKLIIIHFKK
jgi:rhamnosyltransferase